MNIASRILINLFIPGLLEKISGLFSNTGIALSPVIEHDIKDLSGLSLMGSIIINTHAMESSIGIFHNIPRPINIPRIESIITESIVVSQSVLRLLTKENYSLAYVKDPVSAGAAESQPLYRVDLACSSMSNEEFSLSFVFGNNLLHMFSPVGISERRIFTLENDIISFFSAPHYLFPRLGPLLRVLNDTDLQYLFYALLNNNQLSPYQITLMLSFVPGMSLRFKHDLPSKIFQDAIEIKKRMASASRINRRDIAGGVYSVEEAIYHLISREMKISISRPLLEIKKLLSLASSLELFRGKEFRLWLEIMKSDKLLMNTLATSGENDTVRALSGNPLSYVQILTGVLPIPRIKELLSLSESMRLSSIDRMMSQLKIVNTYRKLKVSRFYRKPDNCEYLILCFDDPKDYTRLVFEAGWFTVSTAAKGFKKRTVARLLQDLYPPARFLIEDVLNGTVNPNILHDEIQVHKAQEKCLSHILTLYEGGIISLSV